MDRAPATGYADAMASKDMKEDGQRTHYRLCRCNGVEGMNEREEGMVETNVKILQYLSIGTKDEHRLMIVLLKNLRMDEASYEDESHEARMGRIFSDKWESRTDHNVLS